MSALPKPIDGHELWMRLSVHISNKERPREYVRICEEWCEFLGAETGTDEGARLFLTATDVHAAAYAEWLKKQPGIAPRLAKSPTGYRREPLPTRHQTEWPLANATVSKRIGIVKKFYEVAHKAGLCVRNPFWLVSKPPDDPGAKRPTEMVPFDRVTELVEAPDPSVPKGLRDRAILAAGFGGGLRRGEIVKLRLGDVAVTESGAYYLRLLRTKSKKDYRHAIPDWSADHIIRFINYRLSQGAHAEDCIFLHQHRGSSKHMDSSTIRYIFIRYCKKIGLTTWCTPHSARATAITKLLDDGNPIEYVQEFARHSSSDLTLQYDKRRKTVEQGLG
jgi:integrase/recombinase XerD